MKNCFLGLTTAVTLTATQATAELICHSTANQDLKLVVYDVQDEETSSGPPITGWGAPVAAVIKRSGELGVLYQGTHSSFMTRAGWIRYSYQLESAQGKASISWSSNPNFPYHPHCELTRAGCLGAELLNPKEFAASIHLDGESVKLLCSYGDF